MKAVKDAAATVLYSAAKLGVATHMANNHPVCVTLQDGSTRQQLVRDSTADRPRPTNRKKRGSKAGSAPAAPGLLHTAWQQASKQSDSSKQPDRSVPPEWEQASKQANKPIKKRRMSTKAENRQKRAADIMRLKENLSDEVRVAQWIATRNLKPSSGESAQTRLQRLEARISKRLCRVAN